MQGTDPFTPLSISSPTSPPATPPTRPKSRSKGNEWVWIEEIQVKGPKHILSWTGEQKVAWHNYRLQKHRQRNAKNKKKKSQDNQDTVKIKKSKKKSLYKPKNIIFGANVTFDHV